MNKQLYRVIFNKARGLLMAVSELGSAHGGSTHSETDVAPVARLPIARMKLVTFAVMLLTGAHLFYMPIAQAQIVADPSAPKGQQPTVTTTASGLPQVNIQAPNESGLSHNQYTQFDVNAHGAILNNASTGVQSQMGGWVMPNPNLVNSGARVILNEVNSSNPSLLHGYVEVAGQRAQVIIANPSGVTCDGCGFINASRTTMTTGRPLINSGNLEGYVVQRGQVVVQGKGMDTRQSDYTDIIARSVKVNAGIWANNLRVTTGSNKVNADNVVQEKIHAGGIAPESSIDVAQLGGMYAQKIVLVGTEAGVGMRNAGNIGAAAGEVTITADGRIGNSGQITSGKVQLASQTVDNDGLLDGSETLVKAQVLNNTGHGRIYGDHVALQASVLTNASTMTDGARIAPVIAARRRLDIGAGMLGNREHATLFSGGDMVIGGALDDNDQATGQADILNNNSATIDATDSLSMTAKEINNTNEHFETEEAEVERTHHREYEINGTRHDESRVATEDEEKAKEMPLDSDGNPKILKGSDYVFHEYDSIIYETRIRETDPGQMTAGRNININADLLSNDKSRILAGGDLNSKVGTLNNIDGVWKKIETYEGASAKHHIYIDRPGPFNFFGHKKTIHNIDHAAYVVAPMVQPDAALQENAYGGHQKVEGSGTEVALRADNSAFSQMARSTMGYLIESDPRFTSYRQWISSDFFLQQLELNKDLLPKRLGDGFYEISLVRQQIAALTGKRFLDGENNDEEEYKKLLEAGASFIRKHKLRVGAELTKEQIAQLTTNVVLLVERHVILPDGSKTMALVPKLYLHGSNHNFNGAGAIISAGNMHLDVKDEANNSGTIAARHAMEVNADTLNNMGGHITASDAAILASSDINMLGGTIAADGTLKVKAGHDLNMVSATTSEKVVVTSDNNASGTAISSVATLKSNGTLDATADHDMQLDAAQIVNQGEGSTTLAAGNDLKMGTVTEQSSQHVSWGHGHTDDETGTTDVGSSISASGDMQLKAGNDLATKGSTVQTEKGKLDVRAGHDVKLEEAKSTLHTRSFQKRTESGFLSKKTVTTEETLDQTASTGSTFAGNEVNVKSGNDLTVTGSDIVSDNGTVLDARGNVTLNAVTDTTDSMEVRNEVTEGVFHTDGLNLTIGTKEQEQQNHQIGESAVKSTVGSVNGNVTINTGNAYTQRGSDVLTPNGDVDIAAKSVNIEAAKQQAANTQNTQSEQTGLTVQVTNPVMELGQSIQQLHKAVKGLRQDENDQKNKNKNNRMKVLATTAAVSSLYNFKHDQKITDLAGVGQAATTFGVSASIGKSASESSSKQEATTARGSTLNAGGHVNIKATGGGADSNVVIQGSDVKAGGDVALKADNEVKLLAEQNTTSARSDNKSMSVSIGAGADTKAGLNLNVSISGSKGHDQGHSATHVNTHVDAGNKLSIQSGTDTTLSGAVASGKQVTMDVGTSGKGNLNVSSLQDTETYESRQTSRGGSIAYGTGVSGNIDASHSRVDAQYASVIEQSGINAGAEGFQINVAGNTDLHGGKIASTDAAAADGKNSLTTETLTQSDIHNESKYKAKSVSVSVGSTGGGGFGFGDDADHDSSVTQSGISQANVNITDDAVQQEKTGKTATETLASINKNVSSERDTSGKRKKNWNGQQLQQDVESQAQITKEFGRQVAKSIGTYATEEIKGLNEKIKKATTEKERLALETEKARWAEGGAYRVAMHTAAGTLSGGFNGALGASTSALAMPEIGDMIRTLDVPDPVKKGLAAVTSATLGAAVGGTAGMAAAANAEMNNRQLHPDETAFIKRKAKEYANLKHISIQEAEKLLSRGALYDNDENWQNSYTDYSEKEIAQYKEAGRYIREAAAKEGVTFTNKEGDDQAAFTSSSEQFKDSAYLMAEAFADPATRKMYSEKAAITFQSLSTKSKFKFGKNAVVGFGSGVPAGIEEGLKGYADLLDTETYTKLVEAVKVMATQDDVMQKMIDGMSAGANDAALSVYIGWLQKNSTELGEKSGKIFGRVVVDIVASTAGVSALKATTVATSAAKIAIAAKKISASSSKVIAKKISEQVESSLVKEEKKALKKIKSNPNGPDLTAKEPNSVYKKQVIRDKNVASLVKEETESLKKIKSNPTGPDLTAKQPNSIYKKQVIRDKHVASLVKEETEALQKIKSNPTGPDLTAKVPNSVYNKKVIRDKNVASLVKEEKEALKKIKSNKPGPDLTNKIAYSVYEEQAIRDLKNGTLRAFPPRKGSLSGPKTKPNPLDDAETRRGIKRENESAQTLSEHGYHVEQNKSYTDRSTNPDFELNGEIFDNYAPTSKSIRNIYTECTKKVDKGQTNNVVINLIDTPSVKVKDLQKQFKDWPHPGLEKVIVIDKSGTVFRIL